MPILPHIPKPATMRSDHKIFPSTSPTVHHHRKVMHKWGLPTDVHRKQFPEDIASFPLRTRAIGFLHVVLASFPGSNFARECVSLRHYTAPELPKAQFFWLVVGRGAVKKQANAPRTQSDYGPHETNTIPQALVVKALDPSLTFSFSC